MSIQAKAITASPTLTADGYISARGHDWYTRVQIAKNCPMLRRAMLYSIADEERAKHDCDLDYYWSAMHAAEGCEDSLAELEALLERDK